MDKLVRNLGLTGCVLTLVLCAMNIAYGLKLQASLSEVILLPGNIAAIAGILGLIGAIIAKKKLLTSGVLMIIAVVLCIVSIVIAFSIFYIVSIILFGLGAFIAILAVRFPESKLYQKLTSPVKQKPRPPEQLKL